MTVLYVETNFLIEHARAETEHAEAVVAAAEARKFQLALPMVSIFEALNKRRREGPEHEKWARDLAEHGRNLQRKDIERERREAFLTAAEHLRALTELWRLELAKTVDRLRACAELIAMTEDQLADVLRFESTLKHGDPWVAAAIKSHADRSPTTKLILQRDTKMQEVALQLGIPVVGSSAAALKILGLMEP